MGWLGNIVSSCKTSDGARLSNQLFINLFLKLTQLQDVRNVFTGHEGGRKYEIRFSRMLQKNVKVNLLI